MADEERKPDPHMQWGYKPDGSSKQFPAGEALPKGWSTDPNVIKDPTKRTADAVSGVKAEHRSGGAGHDDMARANAAETVKPTEEEKAA